MGKGDKRTRRGKIFSGSYGNARPKPKKAVFIATAASGDGEKKPSSATRKVKVEKSKKEA